MTFTLTFQKCIVVCIGFVANGSRFGEKPSKNYPNGIARINKTEY
ncbi:hypothetical protein [Emticicia aquatica]|nr:hypothetical protein [Emticicia aquatica]